MLSNTSSYSIACCATVASSARRQKRSTRHEHRIAKPPDPPAAAEGRPSSGRGTGHRVGTVAAVSLQARMDRVVTSRGRRFRHHHAAAHTDRGENHDPTGTLITAQALNGGLDHLARDKRTVPDKVPLPRHTTRHRQTNGP